MGPRMSSPSHVVTRERHRPTRKAGRRRHRSMPTERTTLANRYSNISSLAVVGGCAAALGGGDTSCGAKPDELQRAEVMRQFDERLRNQKPSADRVKLKSSYHQSLLRVSWNLIESEILHCPDSFDLGYDIQQYYTLHQSLTLEDLARTSARHTMTGLLRVVNKVLKHLEDLSAVDDYLRCVGRLHHCAGVDPHYLDLTGLAFCQALEHLGHHVDIWNSEVKETWQTFFRVVVHMMKKGYTEEDPCNRLLIAVDQKSLITEVWVTFQDNIIHYLKNSLLLPLVIRSNRTICKYFVAYDSTISSLAFPGSGGTETLDKTKHASWFLTGVLSRVIPHLDSFETCDEYLMTLGRRHQDAGVRIEHLDLLALVYCSAVRAVVAGQGIRGGPLFETTRAWLRFLRMVINSMKRGYSMPKPIQSDDESDPMESVDIEAIEEVPEDDESNNFFVMKRRNAFWRLDHRESLSGSVERKCPVPHNSLDSGGPAPESRQPFRNSAVLRMRQFSLQF